MGHPGRRATESADLRPAWRVGHACACNRTPPALRAATAAPVDVRRPKKIMETLATGNLMVATPSEDRSDHAKQWLTPHNSGNLIPEGELDDWRLTNSVYSCRLLI